MGGPHHISIEECRPRRALSRLLYKEMQYSSTTIVGVYGRTGAGKSIYAMKVAHDFYRDWDLLLNCIIFTPFDFQEVSDYLEEVGAWIPVIIWDDAGPWMELLKRTPWHPLTIGVRGILETMRLRIGAVILTMTNERSLPRPILYNGSLYKYRARVLRNGTNGVVPKSIVEIQVRREKRSEWGSYYWDSSISFRDQIVLRMPNYDEYERLRRLYIRLYNKMVAASREVAPAKILDFIYREWKKMGLDVRENIQKIIEHGMEK